MRGRGIVAGAVLVTVACVLPGCGSLVASHAVIEVSAPTALADQAVRITVSDLAADSTVTVAATSADYHGKLWRGQATFRADGHGVVDLDRDRPLSGSYSGVDGMGLFWSMNPPSGDPDRVSFRPPTGPSYRVRITVSVGGQQLAERTLTREWRGSGVTLRTLSVAKEGIYGDLFLPPSGTQRHPGVLVFGGSEGDNSLALTGALLASHGYPALTLAYFDDPGLPGMLSGVPLEYFARAGRLLAAQPGVDATHLVVCGYSRGTEAALLLAHDYPDLFHAVIVYAPTWLVHAGYPTGGDAWTYRGKPVEAGAPLPLTASDGPVLAIAGTEDKIWPSVPSAQRIASLLTAAGDRSPHQPLIIPGAGHLVGTYPYQAEGIILTSPSSGQVLDLGGSRAGDAAAQERSWPAVLAFLADLG